MQLPDKHQLELWAIQAAKGATALERELAASNLLGAAVLYQSEYEKLKTFWRTVATATIAANPVGTKVIAVTEVDGVATSAEVLDPPAMRARRSEVDAPPVRALGQKENGTATLVPAGLHLVKPDPGGAA